MIYTCKIGSQHLIFSLHRNIQRNPIPELQFIIERDKKKMIIKETAWKKEI